MASIAGQEGERLRRAAIAGDVTAQTAWAKILLSLQPPNQREGLDYIAKAAARGDAEALYLLARYTAAGLVQPGTWSEAIALLRRAAQAGWEPARRELGALLGEAPRERDVSGLIGPRARTIVFSDPRIATVANFLSAEECAWLRERAEPKLEPARLYDPRAGYRYDPHRSNRAYHFPMFESDMVMLAVQARIANTLGMPADSLESCAVLHYTVGQEFRTHHDFQNLQLYAHIVQQLGQRVVTFLIYLNEDFEGGETHFPELDWRFKGRAGEAIFFWNVGTDGAGDLKTLHAGLPPTSGEKWLLSQWVRDRNRPGFNVPWAK